MIGASRITYSMASYRQLPEVFRRLHPRLKTPWLALVVFAGIAPILILLPGDVTFVGTLYSLGATLSFTVAHAALVRIRMEDRRRTEAPVYRARPNLTVATVDWPVFAIVGGIATGISFLVIVVRTRPRAGWVSAGSSSGSRATPSTVGGYVGASLGETTKAPPAFGPALALEYRRIVVPIVPGRPSDDALDMACRLAAERGARVVALTVLEVPLDMPLDLPLPEEERAANAELDEAIAIGDTYGVRVVGRLVRGRSASKEIVREAEIRGAEIIVLGSPRKDLVDRRRGVFGSTVDRVMRNAPCRVMVTASRAGGRRVKWYSRAVYAFGVVFVAIGIALLVVTASRGGGVVGFLLGGLFVALGVARIHVERARSRGR